MQEFHYSASHHWARLNIVIFFCTLNFHTLHIHTLHCWTRDSWTTCFLFLYLYTDFLHIAVLSSFMMGQNGCCKKRLIISSRPTSVSSYPHILLGLLVYLFMHIYDCIFFFYHLSWHWLLTPHSSKMAGRGSSLPQDKHILTSSSYMAAWSVVLRFKLL